MGALPEMNSLFDLFFLVVFRCVYIEERKFFFVFAVALVWIILLSFLNCFF